LALYIDLQLLAGAQVRPQIQLHPPILIPIQMRIQIQIQIQSAASTDGPHSKPSALPANPLGIRRSHFSSLCLRFSYGSRDIFRCIYVCMGLYSWFRFQFALHLRLWPVLSAPFVFAHFPGGFIIPRPGIFSPS